MSNGKNSLERLWRLETKVNQLVSDGKRSAEDVSNALQGILEGSFVNVPRQIAEIGTHYYNLQGYDGVPVFGATSPKWREKDGVLYFSVVSDGTTGDGWIERLEGNGFRVAKYAEQVLRSSDFNPTSNVTTEVAVLKDMLFEDDDRITENICAEAYKRKLANPNAELACLIREKFTDSEIEKMGLQYIVVMHEPIGDSVLLDADRGGVGCWLGENYDRPGSKWSRGRGFAFIASQVGFQP